MPRVEHFEIHTGDPARTIAFYSKLFDWKFDQWGPQEYWLVTSRGTVDGSAVTAFVCTVEVKSLEATEKTLLELGGSIALGRQAIPGVGWLSYARDTEGNIFGLHQTDENAS